MREEEFRIIEYKDCFIVERLTKRKEIYKAFDFLHLFAPKYVQEEWTVVRNFGYSLYATENFKFNSLNEAKEAVRELEELNVHYVNFEYCSNDVPALPEIPKAV